MKKYFRFTKKFIEEVKTLKKRERYYDTLADGLVLSVTSAGAKSFYVKFWRSDQALGSHVERVIGQSKDMTIDQARNRLRELKSEFVLADPRLEKDKKIWCLQDFHNKWKKDIDHEVRVGAATERYARIKDSLWLNHMPTEITMQDINRLDMQELVAHLQGRREHSHAVHVKLTKHIKSLFKIGLTRLEVNCKNILVSYKAGEDYVRERFISIEEMPRFIAAVHSEDKIYNDLIYVLLFTAQRKDAVMSMAWVDLDLAGKTWRIPSAKMKGRPNGYVIPLTDLIVDILNQRSKNKQPDETYVFPSTCSASGYITGEHFWDRIRDKCGMKDIRLHDLRRTMGSWLSVSGVDIYKISKVLAHKDVRVTQKVYAHLQAVDARDEMNRVAEMMMSEKKDAAESSDSLETLAANLSGEDKMKMISLLSRSMI
jgi:integrase